MTTPVGYSTLQNPRTGEIRAIDASDHSTVASLYRQGWVPVAVKPEIMSEYRKSQTQPAASTTKSTPQYTVTAVDVDPIRAPLAVTSPQLAQSDLATLSKYQTGNGYNLVSLMQDAVNKPELKTLAQQYFPARDVGLAETAAKPPLDIDLWRKLTPERQQYFRPVTEATTTEYAQMTEVQRLNVGAIVPDKVSVAGSKQLGEGLKDRVVVQPSGWQEKVAAGSIMAAEIMLPAYYTVRNWRDMGAAEKALMITVDALSLLPIGGSAVRGARASKAMTTSGRLAGAGRGISNELVAQVRWPIDIMIHPIETIKGITRFPKYAERNAASLIENIFSPKKIPEAVITTTDGTIRIPVKYTTSPQEAKAIADEIVKLSSTKGISSVSVEVNGLRVDLPRSPLMQRTGGLTHTTPMGEAWEGGTMVALKPDLPPIEQGLFLSPEPLPRFAFIAAFGKGGERPTIIIVSPKTAQKARASSGIFAGTAELERVIPPNTMIYEPKQRLYTRIGPMQEKVEIWLEEPLSVIEIAKLKASGLIESIKTLGTPAIRIRKFKSSLSQSEIDELTKLLKRSNSDVAEQFRKTTNVVLRGRYAPPATTRLIGDTVSATTKIKKTRVENKKIERALYNLSRKIRGNQIVNKSRPTRGTETQVTVPRGFRLPESITNRRNTPDRASRNDILDRPDISNTIDHLTRPPRRTRRTSDEPEKSKRFRLPSTGEDNNNKTYYALSGAVGWKQGFIYKYVIPYKNKQIRIFNSRKPIHGIPIVDGPRSAYESLTRLGSHFPREALIDMGIMDVHITKKGKKISFKRDPKQKTTLNRYEGEASVIVPK